MRADEQLLTEAAETFVPLLLERIENKEVGRHTVRMEGDVPTRPDDRERLVAGFFDSPTFPIAVKKGGRPVEIELVLIPGPMPGPSPGPNPNPEPNPGPWPNPNPNDAEVLEEAVGWPLLFTIVLPQAGGTTTYYGAAFSYYEFKQPMSDRLTDEAWQARLANPESRLNLPTWFPTVTADK
jgi:hypothetical protein